MFKNKLIQYCCSPDKKILFVNIILFKLNRHIKTIDKNKINTASV